MFLKRLVMYEATYAKTATSQKENNSIFLRALIRTCCLCLSTCFAPVESHLAIANSATFPWNQKKETLHHFSPNGRWNKSQKENRHSITPLPFCTIFPGLIKSILIPRFGFNTWAEFRMCFGNQSSTNTKRSFAALTSSILLFQLLINL